MRRFLTLAANRIDEIGARLQRQSNAARAAVAGVALVSWIAVIGLTWFSVDLIRSTPRKNELSRVGDMAQATTLLDSQRAAGLHDLQGAAHRGAAVTGLAARW